MVYVLDISVFSFRNKYHIITKLSLLLLLVFAPVGYWSIRPCLSIHVHLNYLDLLFFNKNCLHVHGTTTMHPQFLMKMSEGQFSTRNQRVCRDIKGNRPEFYTKPFLLYLVFHIQRWAHHLAIRLISVICCMFKIFRILTENYCTDAGLWWRFIKKENTAWKQMFGFWSTNIADTWQISSDFTKFKG